MALKDTRAATVLHKTFWGEDAEQTQVPNSVQIAILTTGSQADESDVWASGLQIRIDSSNGKDPDGSDGT